MYWEQQTVVQCKNYTQEKRQKAWYIPVHFMYWAEFQLAKASSIVQIKTIWGKTRLYTKWMIPI